MRMIAVALGCLVLVTSAIASSVVDVAVLPKPGFPAPATDVVPDERKLVLRSSRYRSPAEVRTYDRQVVAQIIGP